jgi:hypothetical protein
LRYSVYSRNIWLKVFSRYLTEFDVHLLPLERTSRNIFGQAAALNCSRKAVKFSSHSVVCTIVSVRLLNPKESLASALLICAAADNFNIRSIDSSAGLVEVHFFKLVPEFKPVPQVGSIQYYPL